MSTRQKSSLAQFLERHSASAHAVEPARAQEEPQSTPFFDQVVARVSGAESFEAVLTKLTGPVEAEKIAQYPTAQCLTPEQVYDLRGAGPERQAYLATCPWCKNMMVAAQPSSEEFEQICRKAKSATNSRRGHEMAAG